VLGVVLAVPGPQIGGVLPDRHHRDPAALGQGRHPAHRQATGEEERVDGPGLQRRRRVVETELERLEIAGRVDVLGTEQTLRGADRAALLGTDRDPLALEAGERGDAAVGAHDEVQVVVVQPHERHHLAVCGVVGRRVGLGEPDLRLALRDEAKVLRRRGGLQHARIEVGQPLTDGVGDGTAVEEVDAAGTAGGDP
jgi:hypothetical protein